MPIPTSLSGWKVLGTNRPNHLPDDDTLSGTATDTLDWTVPAVELNVVNLRDAEITFVVTDDGPNSGKTFPVPANASRPYVAPGITRVVITSAGTTGKWYVDAFR